MIDYEPYLVCEGEAGDSVAGYLPPHSKFILQRQTVGACARDAVPAHDIYSVHYDLEPDGYFNAGLSHPRATSYVHIPQRMERIQEALPRLSLGRMNAEEAFFVLTGIFPARACMAYLWNPSDGWVNPTVRTQRERDQVFAQRPNWEVQEASSEEKESVYYRINIFGADRWAESASLAKMQDNVLDGYPLALRGLTMRPDFGLMCIETDLKVHPINSYEKSIRERLMEPQLRLSITAIANSIEQNKIARNATLAEWLRLFKSIRLDVSHIPEKYFDDGIVELEREIQFLRANCEKLESDLVGASNSLVVQRENFNATIASLQKAIDEYQVKIDVLEREMHEARTETDRLDAELQSKNKELTKQIAALDLLKADHDTALTELKSVKSQNIDQDLHPKERKTLLLLLSFMALKDWGWDPDNPNNNKPAVQIGHLARIDQQTVTKHLAASVEYYRYQVEKFNLTKEVNHYLEKTRQEQANKPKAISKG